MKLLAAIQIKKIPSIVKITVSDTPMYLPPSLQEAINSNWETLLSRKTTFHRGELFSIRKLSEKDDALHVTLHKTDFAHFIYSENHSLPEDFKYRAIVANGLILTKDNYYILGQMNDQTANPGQIQFIAGGIDNEDVNGSTVDIYTSLIREAKEEIGINLNDENLVVKVEPRYIVHWGSVALIYLIKLGIDSEEFQIRYNQFEKTLLQKGIKPEFSYIVLLSADPASVNDFLQNDDRPKLDFLPIVLKSEMNIL